MSEKGTGRPVDESRAHARDRALERTDELPVNLIERARSPTGLGEIPEPDGYAYVRADCGDSMEILEETLPQALTIQAQRTEGEQR